MSPLPTGSVVPIDSRYITDAHPAGSRIRERLPVELLKLRAETFAFQLERDRQRSLATGQSMPPEWTASLERERQSLLAQIQCRRSVQDTESLPATGAVAIHPPIRPPPSTFRKSNGPRRSLAPHLATRTSRRPATILPSIQPIPSCILPPVPRVAEYISSDLVIESDDDDVDERNSYISVLDRVQKTSPKSSTPTGAPIQVHRYPAPSANSRKEAIFSKKMWATPDDEQEISELYSTKQGALPNEPTTRPIPSHLSTAIVQSSSLLHPTPLKLFLTETEVQATLVNGVGEHMMNLERRHFGDDCPLLPKYPSIHESSDQRCSMEDHPLWPDRSAPPTSLSPLDQWGITESKNFTMPGPETKESLRYPMSLPTRPHSLDITSTKNVGGEAKSLTYLKAPQANDVTCRVMDICIRLVEILSDLTMYKKFLSYRDEAAQSLLDFLQTLLDYSQLEERFRTILFVALIRLSRKSGLYPQRFTLSDVIQEGDHPITAGHFGEIYKGSFRGRVVCIKVIRMYGTSEHARLYKAFAREAILWAQLSHTNVLPFFGISLVGNIHRRINLVGPWMKHGNINEFLRKYADADRSLLISDVAAGLLYLHKNEVIHGDLKGSNILVNDSERACLADFGLASVTDSHGLEIASLSSGNLEGGAIRFLAPELMNPDFECPKSKASDIYALALVCYEIFTGNRPFPEVNKDYTVTIRVLQGDRPTRPMDVVYRNRGLTDSMWRLMEDCWKHMPKNRPTAYQIVERLKSLTHKVDERRVRDWNWGDLSPSRLRVSNARKLPEHADLSIAESLRALEMNGISWFSSPEFRTGRSENSAKRGGDMLDQVPKSLRRQTSIDEEKCYSHLIASLELTFEDIDAYKQLLSCQGEQAQALLHTFQALLGLDTLEDQFRNKLVVAMGRLSRKAGLYPEPYDLEDLLSGD